MHNPFRTFKVILVISAKVLLVTSAVTASLLLFHVAFQARQSSHSDGYSSDHHGEWRSHESLPILIGGVLAGGAVGGAMAAWLFLKSDFEFNDRIEEVDRKLQVLDEKLGQKLDEKLSSFYADLKTKIAYSTHSINDHTNVSIRKINELQSSIDKLKDSTS